MNTIKLLIISIIIISCTSKNTPREYPLKTNNKSFNFDSIITLQQLKKKYGNKIKEISNIPSELHGFYLVTKSEMNIDNIIKTELPFKEFRWTILQNQIISNFAPDLGCTNKFYYIEKEKIVKLICLSIHRTKNSGEMCEISYQKPFIGNIICTAYKDSGMKVIVLRQELLIDRDQTEFYLKKK